MQRIVDELAQSQRNRGQVRRRERNRQHPPRVNPPGRLGDFPTLGTTDHPPCLSFGPRLAYKRPTSPTLEPTSRQTAMPSSDDLFDRLGRLDDIRFRAVAQSLERGQLQKLVIAASRGGSAAQIDIVRRLVDERREECHLPMQDTGNPEVSQDPPPPDPTLLSWDKLEGILGGRQAVEQLEGLFEIAVPLQDQLGPTSIDAFGLDLHGIEALLGEHLSVSADGFEAMIQQAVGDSDFSVEYDIGGLNLVWFTRGPALRRRPYIYLVADGQIGKGDAPGDEDNLQLAPFIAQFDGPDAAVTPESWTEWFAEVGIERGKMQLGAASLSLSFFQSADGPFDVSGLAGRLLQLAGQTPSADGSSGGWQGWSLGMDWGGDPGDSNWVGSAYYG